MPSYKARNGPARQRRGDRRATARAEANAASATDEATEDVPGAHVEARAMAASGKRKENEFKDAVEVTDLEAATAFEPADEISREAMTDEKLEKLCESVSVIPVRRVNADDDTIEKVIKDKFFQKGVTILEFGIHRSVDETFIRFDARIGPTYPGGGLSHNNTLINN